MAGFHVSPCFSSRGKNLRFGVGREFESHDAVNHGAKEYVRYAADVITTNTVEGFYSIFKRGMKGVYQHCAEKHPHRYLSEFDFRGARRQRWGTANACH